MSKPIKLVLITLVLSVVLTLGSLIVQHQTFDVSSMGTCNYVPQSETTRGYPFGYLLPASMGTSEMPQYCIERGANTATDYVAQHTPGHQQIYSVIQNHDLSVSALAQDFAIMFLIALYPSSLIVTRWKGGQKSPEPPASERA